MSRLWQLASNSRQPVENEWWHMTNSEIQCLKDHVDRLVEIETADGEVLTGKVISVFYDGEQDEHELFYELVSTNMPEARENVEDTAGYALDFENILSVRPVSEAKG